MSFVDLNSLLAMGRARVLQFAPQLAETEDACADTELITVSVCMGLHMLATDSPRSSLKPMKQKSRLISTRTISNNALGVTAWHYSAHGPQPFLLFGDVRDVKPRAHPCIKSMSCGSENILKQCQGPQPVPEIT